MWPFKKKSVKPEKILDRALITEEDIRQGDIELKRKQTRLKTKRLKMLEDQADFLEQMQQERQMQMQIDEMKEDLFGSDDEPETDFEGNLEDKLLMKLLDPMLKQQGGAGKVSSNQGFSSPPNENKEYIAPNTDTAPSIHLTDEKLMEIKGKIPEAKLKLFNALSDNQKRGMILAELPDIDDDTLERAIKI